MPDEPPSPAPSPLRDRAGVRLVAFVGGLALALLAGFGVGRLAGPVNAAGGMDPGMGQGMGGGASGGMAPDGHVHNPDGTISGTGTSGADQVGGLAISSSGYTLVPAGMAGSTFSFHVNGPDRKPVTTFAVVHDKPMHLIVVRRDLSGYRHVHPAMAADGTWSIDLPLGAPGVYRAYADFTATDPGGAQVPLTLGADLTVAGGYQPRELPAVARESTVDKFTATYEGAPQIGTTQPMLFRVFSNGAPVTNLERYLGSYGHLVVLREGDLGYVHVHPEQELAGEAVKFWLAAPSPGRYRMFFDFQVAGAVHTAEYTVVIP